MYPKHVGLNIVLAGTWHASLPNIKRQVSFSEIIRFVAIDIEATPEGLGRSPYSFAAWRIIAYITP